MIAFPDTGDECAVAPTTPAAPALSPKGTGAPMLTTSPADTERLGDEIARLAAHLHAATYQLLVLIREFDERGGWEVGSFHAPNGCPGAPGSALARPGKRSG